MSLLFNASSFRHFSTYLDISDFFVCLARWLIIPTILINIILLDTIILSWLLILNLNCVLFIIIFIAFFLNFINFIAFRFMGVFMGVISHHWTRVSGIWIFLLGLTYFSNCIGVLLLQARIKTSNWRNLVMLLFVILNMKHFSASA